MVEAENTSADFQTFSPQRLSLVGKNNIQVNLVASRQSYYYRPLPPYDPRIPVPISDQRIAPGARVKGTYGLSGKLQLPAQLYYEEKLIAVITK